MAVKGNLRVSMRARPREDCAGARVESGKETMTMRGQTERRAAAAAHVSAASDQKSRLMRALEGEPTLAPGIQRSMVRAFWSKTPLAAHADPRAIAGLIGE